MKESKIKMENGVVGIEDETKPDPEDCEYWEDWEDWEDDYCDGPEYCDVCEMPYGWCDCARWY